MADERIMIVPLRREFLKAPQYRRTKKAVNALRQFIAKHTKVSLDNVKLGKFLNNKMWENGIQNPPHKVKITVVKDDKGIVMAELFGTKVKKAEEKKSSKKATSKTEEKQESKESVKEDAKVEEKKAAPKKKVAKKEE